MKKALLSIVLFGLVSYANAVIVIDDIVIAYAVGGLGVAYAATDINDPRKHKLVKAAWANNPNGYHFDATQFEVEESQGKIILVK